MDIKERSIENMPYLLFCEDDLKNVSEWLNTGIGGIKFEFIREDIDKFKKQITEMEKCLIFNIDEWDRVKLIIDLLEGGEPPYAIFVDKNDNFILEGRHRIVACHRFGLKTIPVYYVSIKEEGKYI